MKRVTAITATCGRHTCLERLVGMFLAQDYQGPHTLLIFNNSEIPLSLDKFIDDGTMGYMWYNDWEIMFKGETKTIHLVNQYSEGGYRNLGHIYTEAIKHVSDDTDIITFMDDDDLFLPNHISEGLKGLEKCGKTAYKPAQSYFRYQGGISLMNNTLEPSIFVEAFHVKKYGFSETTTEQHLQWVTPLVEQGEIFADPDGTPTLIYNWGDDFPTFKTSGDYKNPLNFDNYRKHSQDHGDRIITPWAIESLKPYYNLVNVTA